jgi:hypothetical protein
LAWVGAESGVGRRKRERQTPKPLGSGMGTLKSVQQKRVDLASGTMNPSSAHIMGRM